MLQDNQIQKKYWTQIHCLKYFEISATNASKITEIRTFGPEIIASTKKVRNQPQMDLAIFRVGEVPKS